jgi:hypothetical protein
MSDFDCCEMEGTVRMKGRREEGKVVKGGKKKW